MSTSISPFKFLDSYQEEDRDIFFGREKETEALYEALSGVKHLLVYGPSGAGKTSLIECGLRNQFSDADWFALTIRRGTNLNASVFARIQEALEERFEIDPFSQLPVDAGINFGKAIENLFAERYQPIYLLFDQFEELLISGTEEEKQDFFIRLNQLIRYKVPCRMILIMREEFIGHLSEFEPLCPSIFQHRFRLEKMRRGNVLDVIQRTLEARQYQSYFKVEGASALAVKMLSKLPDERREIELAHVQVFLGELWDRAEQMQTVHALPTLHAGLIADGDNLEGVLDHFLKTQLEEMDVVYGEKKAVEVLALLISERHTKIQATAESLQEELKAKEVHLLRTLDTLLGEFVRRRILRTVKAGSQTQYEISHDVLAKVVGDNLTEEMKLREKARDIYQLFSDREGFLSQEDLDYLRPYERYLAMPAGLKERMVQSEKALAARQKAELLVTRKRLRNVVGLLVGAVSALIAAGYFWYDADVQKNTAQRALLLARTLEIQADSARNLATEKLRQALVEKRNRLHVEISEANRALAVYEKADYEASILETRKKIDSLIQLETGVQNEILNVE